MVTQPDKAALAEICGALARGYCHPDNSHKVLDAALIAAMAQEIAALRADDGMRDVSQVFPDLGPDWTPPNPAIEQMFSRQMTTDEIISRCYEHGQPDYVLAADRLKELQAKCDPDDGMREALAFLMDTKWKSVDKDNMEFEGRVTCYQLDKARAALAASGEKG